jgi:dipeptidyl aminopeptidase/acylaminoacyl peptidase
MSTGKTAVETRREHRPDLRHHDVEAAASPVTYVAAENPPFLIIHGNKDPAVPYNQSERLSAALKQATVDCYFITVDGGGHGGFRNPEVQKRERQFFDKYLRGAKATCLLTVSGEPR